MNNNAENLVCGQAIVRPSNFTGEYQLRMHSRGLPDSTKGLSLLLSRQSHKPCIGSHESVLPVQGKEPVELRFQELWPHCRH